MESHTIMVIRIDNRSKNAPIAQEILTKYGCTIKMRLGLHETSDEFCSNDGLILLQLKTGKEVDEFTKELSALQGITVKTIEI